MLYIEFVDKTPAESIDIEEDVFYEIDDEGHLIGLEILYASDKYKDFNKIEFEHYAFPVKRKAKKRVKKQEITTA